MVALVAALALTATLNSTADVEPLPSRPLPIEPFVIPANHFVNFDLIDARAELAEPAARGEVQHSHPVRDQAPRRPGGRL